MTVTRTRKLASAAALSAAVLLPATGCSALPGTAQPDTVLVGASLPLTGADAALGTIYHHALQLQTEVTNQQGRLGDRRLELLVRDSRSDAGTAAEDLAALAADPRVSVVVAAGCPDCVVTAAPELTLPVISLDAEPEVAAPVAERRWVFKLGPDPGDNADRLCQEIARQGAETVGVIATDDPYGRAGATQVAAAAERDDLTVATDQRVPPDADRAAVAAAADAVAGWPPAEPPPTFGQPAEPAGPDAVIVWARAPVAGTITAAVRAAGYDGPLFLDSLASLDLFPAHDRAAGYAGATLVFTDTPAASDRIATSPQAAARKNWFSRYVSRHGGYHLPASWGADAIRVITDAVNRAAADGAGGREAIRDKIETTRLDGLTGLIRFTAAEHSGLHPSSLALLTNDEGHRWTLAR